MKIERLSLKNFLSFKDNSLSFGGRQLALILGINNDTTSMDSNGSGKSVLFEGIVWGLFGKTFRGLKGDKVVNTKAKKDCQVNLDLSINGSKITVTRYRKHTIHKDNLILEIDGQEQQRMTPTETQELLEDTIRMDYATFMNTSVFPEGAFISLANMVNESDKKDLLESVAGIVSFDGYQKSARDRRKGIQESIDKQTTELTATKSGVETEEQMAADLNQRHEEFAEKKKEKMVHLKDKIEEMKSSLKQIEGNAIGFNLTSLQKIIEEKKGSLKNLEIDEDQRQNFIQSIANLQGEIVSLDVRKNEFELELSELNKLKPGQKCPLFKGKQCEQMTEGDIKEYLGKIQAKISNIDELIKGQTLKRLTNESSLNAINNQRAAFIQVEESIGSDEVKLGELQRKQLSMAPFKEKAIAELWAMDKEYTDAEKKISPYASMIEENEKRLRSLQEKKNNQETGLEKAQENQKYVQFWVDGFGDRGLKSFLLDSVVQQLNEQTNHYLAYLTDGEIRIDISTRTMLKGGGEREKLNIKVYSEGGMQEYEGCSGGERRRVDVSMLLALRELAKARLEQTFDFLFVDELFDKLDKSGIERVLHLFTQQTDDSVFVISHDPSLMDVFENMITVEKTDRISRIV